jgi:magnesium-protoporphyrin IX monomethyl ester (oxidative) cyclase
MEPLLDVRVLDAVAAGYATEIGTGESFTYGLTDDEISAELSSDQPHVVGVSCLFSTQWRNAHRVCRLAKEVNPDVITVMGGAHPSATLSQTLADPNVDYVVVGEGEAALPALIHALRAGQLPAGIEGLAYTKHGHKLRFCFEQKATIMGILTSIPMSSSLGLRRIPHDPDRVY